MKQLSSHDLKNTLQSNKQQSHFIHQQHSKNTNERVFSQEPKGCQKNTNNENSQPQLQNQSKKSSFQSRNIQKQYPKSSGTQKRIFNVALPQKNNMISKETSKLNNGSIRGKQSFQRDINSQLRSSQGDMLSKMDLQKDRQVTSQQTKNNEVLCSEVGYNEEDGENVFNFDLQSNGSPTVQKHTEMIMMIDSSIQGEQIKQQNCLYDGISNKPTTSQTENISDDFYQQNKLLQRNQSSSSSTPHNQIQCTKLSIQKNSEIKNEVSLKLDSQRFQTDRSQVSPRLENIYTSQTTFRDNPQTIIDSNNHFQSVQQQYTNQYYQQKDQCDKNNKQSSSNNYINNAPSTPNNINNNESTNFSKNSSILMNHSKVMHINHTEPHYPHSAQLVRGRFVYEHMQDHIDEQIQKKKQMKQILDEQIKENKNLREIQIQKELQQQNKEDLKFQEQQQYQNTDNNNNNSNKVNFKKFRNYQISQQSNQQLPPQQQSLNEEEFKDKRKFITEASSLNQSKNTNSYNNQNCSKRSKANSEQISNQNKKINQIIETNQQSTNNSSNNAILSDLITENQKLKEQVSKNQNMIDMLVGSYKLQNNSNNIRKEAIKQLSIADSQQQQQQGSNQYLYGVKHNSHQISNKDNAPHPIISSNQELTYPSINFFNSLPSTTQNSNLLLDSKSFKLNGNSGGLLQSNQIGGSQSTSQKKRSAIPEAFKVEQKVHHCRNQTYKQKNLLQQRQHSFQNLQNLNNQLMSSNQQLSSYQTFQQSNTLQYPNIIPTKIDPKEKGLNSNNGNNGFFSQVQTAESEHDETPFHNYKDLRMFRNSNSMSNNIGVKNGNYGSFNNGKNGALKGNSNNDQPLYLMKQGKSIQLDSILPYKQFDEDTLNMGHLIQNKNINNGKPSSLLYSNSIKNTNLICNNSNNSNNNNNNNYISPKQMSKPFYVQNNNNNFTSNQMQQQQQQQQKQNKQSSQNIAKKESKTQHKDKQENPNNYSNEFCQPDILQTTGKFPNQQQNLEVSFSKEGGIQVQ